MLDYQKTIISQYATDPVAVALIGSMNAWLDPSANIDTFYSKVWNILTAVGYGLDVWGRILVFPRTIQVPVPQRFFGFEEALPSNNDTFGHAPFFFSTPATQNVVLPDTLYRSCLLAKAATNIWDGGITGINAILMALFPHRGRAYVTDGLNMTMTYTFEFELTAVEEAIVTSSAVPRPNGVAATVVLL